jgi:peptidyl-prolyl cis-trans isomerase C
VTTQFGYHIIKLSEKIPAQKTPFPSTQKDIKDYLLTQEVQKELPGYLAKLKKEAKVEILDPTLKSEATPPAK